MLDYRDKKPHLVKVFSPRLDNCTFQSVGHGQSDAHVIRITTPGLTGAFLKYAFDAAGDEVREEHERPSWLGAKVPAPRVIAYISTPMAHFFYPKPYLATMLSMQQPQIQLLLSRRWHGPYVSSTRYRLKTARSINAWM